MQKLLSSIIYSICLILLSLAYINDTKDFLSNFAPFCTTGNIKPVPPQTITPESLGITASSTEPSNMYSKAYCLVDADSNRILASKDEDMKLPMASTTKIMTCIIALENGDMGSIVTASQNAASMPDVQLNMKAGERFILQDLLYSLMLESHNDTAVAIAEHIGGSVEGFAKLMNLKAEELGLGSTHFVTPNGLDADEHYTTAYELCCIASYAIQNEDFMNIVQTPSHQFSNYDGTRAYSVNNKDAFLTSYNGAIGIKTGFTGNAGYCFCGAARRDNVTLVSSVLACGWPPNKGYKWSDTRKLMDYGFKGHAQAAVTPKNPLPAITVSDGKEASVPVKRTSTESFNVLISKDDIITVSYELPEKLSAPVRSGDIIGYENYTINDGLYMSIPIVASKTIDKTDSRYFANILVRMFFANY
ncbi:MAG TPA: D-alanyl-D-alanine carboxypeptidase [Lachnospiraceae bacterium]|nr:D-alanyl-D-alanine carboxypeptidase [Lachnospiraceae bacterium]